MAYKFNIISIIKYYLFYQYCHDLSGKPLAVGELLRMHNTDKYTSTSNNANANADVVNPDNNLADLPD